MLSSSPSTTMSRVLDRDGAVWVAALVLPDVVAAALTPLRDSVSSTNAALVMVVAVVAVAAAGRRGAGVVAALSSALWFDFFLTEPYHQLVIADRADVETAVLLLVVGVTVSELAAWGRRRQDEAWRRGMVLADISEAVDAMSLDPDTAPRVDVACAHLVRLLSLESARFEPGSVPPDRGSCPPDRRGSGGAGRCLLRCRALRAPALPRDRPDRGRRDGDACRFVLKAAPDARPSKAQRLAAVAVAHWAVEAPIMS
jgi:hypothetical protein